MRDMGVGCWSPSGHFERKRGILLCESASVDKIIRVSIYVDRVQVAMLSHFNEGSRCMTPLYLLVLDPRQATMTWLSQWDDGLPMPPPQAARARIIGISSLTLCLCGKDRSVISFHFPVLCSLGIISSLLIWRVGGDLQCLVRKSGGNDGGH